MSRSDPSVVYVLVPELMGYFSGIHRGIRRFALEQRSWRFRICPTPKVARQMLKLDTPHGFVIDTSRSWWSTIRSLPAPAVSIANGPSNVRLPRVGVDEELAGRMGAEHLLERHYQNIAFLGYHGVSYSIQRQRGFCQTMRQAHLTVDIMRLRGFRPMEAEPTLRRWLLALPRPAAVMACHDFLAMQVLNVCRDLKLDVPRDIAVLGIDDFDSSCEMTQPPLSSVSTPAEQIGYQACTLLDSLMRGEPRPREPVLIRPPGLSARRSTDLFAVRDADLAAAMGFIHAHADQPITVDEVANHVAMSRRGLERRFRSILGRSILQEIHHHRLGRAQDLLTRTLLPLKDVAERCGFTQVSHFASLFHRKIGLTPGQFRLRLPQSPLPPQ